jgi:hypothetical protein
VSARYEAPTVAYAGNVFRMTHKCGACGRSLASARWVDSGKLLHVERVAGRGNLELVPELFAGQGLPHVRKSERDTGILEHVCSFVGRAPERKVRP